MSIQRFDDVYYAQCDICMNELDYEGSFQEAVEAKKDAGWRSRKIDGEWEDICDNCLAEEAERAGNKSMKDKAFADVLKNMKRY